MGIILPVMKIMSIMLMETERKKCYIRLKQVTLRERVLVLYFHNPQNTWQVLNNLRNITFSESGNNKYQSTKERRGNLPQQYAEVNITKLICSYCYWKRVCTQSMEKNGEIPITKMVNWYEQEISFVFSCVSDHVYRSISKIYEGRSCQ